jgi:hypothetical protein
VLQSRTRWFAAESPVGVWWLAHCAGFRVEPPPHFGPSGVVEEVRCGPAGGRAELLLVRTGRGRGTAPRPLAATDVFAIDPEHRVVRVQMSLRRATRRAKRTRRGR